MSKITDGFWFSSTWEAGELYGYSNEDQVYIDEGIGQFAHLFYVCNTCHGCAVPVTRADLRRLRDVLNATDLSDIEEA